MHSDTSHPAADSVELNLLAGFHPNGQPVLEKVMAAPQSSAKAGGSVFRLLHSPLFVAGAARGDLIELLNNNPGRFRVRGRSGQLAVRVLCRDDIAALADELTPAIEKLDGVLDVQTPRALVYSIHVAVGFAEIERVLDAAVSTFGAAQWSYGNVYDAETGAPLNWWESLLNP